MFAGGKRMRRVFCLLIFLGIVLTAMPAAAVRMEEQPDYWGAFGTGPVWFEHAGWGLYAQGGYYFTSWIGVGLAVDWSMDTSVSEDEYTRQFDSLYGWTYKHWEYSQRRQWFPAFDLRIRLPLHENVQLCWDLGLGAMIDDTLTYEKDRVYRNDQTSERETDTSEAADDGAFLFRPTFVVKLWNVGIGYRFFLVADGSDYGHMATIGLDWDI